MENLEKLCCELCSNKFVLYCYILIFNISLLKVLLNASTNAKDAKGLYVLIVQKERTWFIFIKKPSKTFQKINKIVVNEAYAGRKHRVCDKCSEDMEFQKSFRSIV